MSRRDRDQLEVRDRLDGHSRPPVADRGLPRLEQLAPPVRAFRQPQRDVAQVDDEAAEPAGDVDREVPAAAAEPDGVAEAELGGGRSAGRQVDHLEPPGTRSICGRGPASARAVDRRACPALRPVRSPAGVTTRAERRQQVVGEVRHHRAPLVVVGDRAERRRGAGRGRGA